MSKVTIGVYKAYKNSGNLRFHKKNTKKHWKHYFIEVDDYDEEYSFGSEWVSSLSAVFLKKNHTVQNQITINLDGVIIHKSVHSHSHHDYKIYKSKHSTLSKELLQFYDLGMEKDFENQISILPYKKKKGMKLTDSQKRGNKFQAKVGIKVEHIMTQIKKFRISCDTFRNKLCRYDTISEIVCVIINFKIRWKQEFIVTP